MRACPNHHLDGRAEGLPDSSLPNHPDNHRGHSGDLGRLQQAGLRLQPHQLQHFNQAGLPNAKPHPGRREAPRQLDGHPSFQEQAGEG